MIGRRKQFIISASSKLGGNNLHPPSKKLESNRFNLTASFQVFFTLMELPHFSNFWKACSTGNLGNLQKNENLLLRDLDLDACNNSYQKLWNSMVWFQINDQTLKSYEFWRISGTHVFTTPPQLQWMICHILLGGCSKNRNSVWNI